MLGEKKLVDDPAIVAIAARLGATPAQVLIAWGVHRGYTVNVKSVHPERVKANFQQLALTDAQYAEITALGNGRHVRFNIPYRYEPGWDISLFDEEAEKEATYKVKIA